MVDGHFEGTVTIYKPDGMITYLSIPDDVDDNPQAAAW
jgi:hypothetical protein